MRECIVRPENGESVRLPVADSFFARAFGLSFRAPDSVSGMLFKFSEPSKNAFWTFGMCFPIDIVWIRDDEIVAIDLNVPPMGLRLKDAFGLRRPSSPIDTVIELPAGRAEDIGFSLHGKITIEYGKGSF
jgi:uncharacterized membrane protein (UPF0127 family)